LIRHGIKALSATPIVSANHSQASLLADAEAFG
jgi:hypothetical protein